MSSLKTISDRNNALNNEFDLDDSLQKWVLDSKRAKTEVILLIKVSEVYIRYNTVPCWVLNIPMCLWKKYNPQYIAAIIRVIRKLGIEYDIIITEKVKPSFVVELVCYPNTTSNTVGWASGVMTLPLPGTSRKMLAIHREISPRRRFEGDLSSAAVWTAVWTLMSKSQKLS